MRALSARGAKLLVMVLMLVALAACSASEHLAANRPEPEAAPPPPPPPPPPAPPPPVDLAGRWKLSTTRGGSCFMNFGALPGAAEGTIAPQGGCPGNFFTSRKWTFEDDVLIMRDHKSEPLAQLMYAGGHFEGHSTNGATLSLTR